MTGPNIEELTQVLPHIFHKNKSPILAAFIEDLGLMSLVKDTKQPLANAIMIMNNAIHRDIQRNLENTPNSVDAASLAYFQSDLVTAHILVLANIETLAAEGELVLCDGEPTLKSLSEVNGFSNENELALYIADLMGWSVSDTEDPLSDIEVGLEISMAEAADILSSFIEDRKNDDVSREDDESESISFFEEEEI